jgi:hypothetical protein
MQGKFKEGAVPPDKLQNIFITMEGGSLDMSSGANTTILGQFFRPACINASFS